MGSLTSAIAKFFFGSPKPEPPQRPKRRRAARPAADPVAKPKLPLVREATAPSSSKPVPPSIIRTPVKPSPPRSQPTPPKACLVNADVCRAPIAYWELRHWRHKGNGIYLGHYRTALGRCHGVIKWIDCDDFNFYIHDVPKSILAGPHGGCFTEVRPGKFQVHFAEWPEDINSGIFYIETLLMEAFQDGYSDRKNYGSPHLRAASIHD